MKVYTMCMDEKTQIVYMTIFAKLIYKGNSNQYPKDLLILKFIQMPGTVRTILRKKNCQGSP